MQYRLRTLLILLAVGPVVLAGVWGTRSLPFSDYRSPWNAPYERNPSDSPHIENGVERPHPWRLKADIPPPTYA